ncbi:unnamed protein product [Urochloa decumbens]|uniref:TFIIS N-terminal domain-containing protein n=1 Tax=Urochloa decumbens TaxID=240449 RepID=A0ABC9BQZ7_9POAL
MALRRLKPLLCAFEYIDAAIEAADAAPGSRDAFRSGRERIVGMVCDVAEDDEGGGEKAEALCALLDEAMTAALTTLREVPAEKIALEAGDLVGAVGELMREHPSERVRGLAGDVARGWRVAVTAEVDRARVRAAMVLDGILATPPPPPLQDDTAPAAGSETKLKTKTADEQPRPRNGRHVRTVECYAPLSKTRSDPIFSSSHAKPSADRGAPAILTVQPKKKPSVAVCNVAEEEKLQATKRKLQERYQEAEDAKRRRTIQVIKPPRPPTGTTGQRQRNAQPGMRARVPASCAAERVLAKSCSLGTRV